MKNQRQKEKDNLDITQVKALLDRIAWDEQMEFELSERSPNESLDLKRELERKIRGVARKMTPPLLNSLQQDKNYAVWALRLSPYVRGDLPAKRALGFVNHPDRNLQYWATKILADKVRAQTGKRS